MANSLKEMLDEQYSKEKEIKNFKLSVEEYLNKEDIHKIIKDSIKNNFKFIKQYEYFQFGYFQISFIPIQLTNLSGVNDSYEIIIKENITTNYYSNCFKAFIREKRIFDYEFIISELHENKITKEEIFNLIKKSIEG